jgi:hypothetical protein
VCCSPFLQTILVEIAADVKMTPRNAKEDGMMRRSTRSMVKVKDVGSKQKENMVRVDK